MVLGLILNKNKRYNETKTQNETHIETKCRSKPIPKFWSKALL